MDRHPSRLRVVENKETGEKFLYDWFTEEIDVEKYSPITAVCPIPEKYWNLPRLKDVIRTNKK